MKWLQSFLLLPLIVLSQTDLSFSEEKQAIKQAEIEVSWSKHTEAEISQSKQKAIIPQTWAEEELEEKPKDMKHFISPAWQYYRQGNYKQAIEIFTTLSFFPETELEAKYGLATCYVKLKKPKKALSLLESLVARRFDLKNTLPVILALLIEEKEYKKAESYLVMLGEKERQKWKETIKTKLLFSEFDEFKKTGSIEKIIELTEANNELLKKCFSPDIFYEAAGALLKDNKEYAISLYKNLLQSCHDKKDLRLSVLYSLKSILPSSDMISLLRNEEGRKLGSDYKNKMNELKISVLMDKLTALPPDSPELETTVREILVLNPEEEGARTMLAWWYYNKGEHEKAYQEFYLLYNRSPLVKDYSYGLVNTLIKLKKLDEALELARKNKEYDERLALIEIELRLSILRKRFVALPPDSKEIDDTANEILALKPDDEGTMAILAWWHFNNGYYEKAYEEFYSLYQRSPETKDYIYGLASTLLKLNKIDEALELASKNKEYDERLASLETDIRLSILWDKLTSLPPDSPELETTAKEILVLKPEEEGARTMLAWWYYSSKHYDKAYEEFYTLYIRSPATKGYAFGLVNSLIKLERFNEALELASKNKEHDERLALIEIELRLSILRERFAVLPPDSKEIDETANEILALKPDDEGTMAILAWWHFNNGYYEKAYDEFYFLYQRNPETKDYIYGLASTLLKLNKTDEALELASKNKEYDERLASIEADIRLSILWDKLTSLPPDSPELEDTIREILVLNPEEEGARTMLAWWYYSNEHYGKAYDEFYTLYSRSPDTKGYAFGLANSLIKLERFDEALELASKNKHADERLVSIEIDIYLEKANAAYRDKKYHEAETYFEMALAENPEDMDVKKLLAWSKYNQTLFGRAMLSIEGLPGYTWGTIMHDINGDTGTGGAGLVNQGIDWINLPGDIILSTFVEYRYRTRTRLKRYFDESGKALGLELKRFPFKLGAEYSWTEYMEQNKTAITNRAYLTWYHEWYKYMKKWSDESRFQIQAFSGYTYGSINHDLDNLTGTGISGAVNQGIDWFTLPGDITLNTYAEYLFGLRTKEKFYYNTHGPALGIELQKIPFEFGMEYFWENYTEQNVTNMRWYLYFTWYYDWNLKPKE